MTNAGVFTLGDIVVTAADTYVGDAITGLDGMTALSVQLRFAYGSGGTMVRAYLQSSLDQGTTWYDMACALFDTAALIVPLNFSGLTPLGFTGSPPAALELTDGAMPDNTSIDGLLGDRVRLKLVTTGTYGGGSILSGRIAAR